MEYLTYQRLFFRRYWEFETSKKIKNKKEKSKNSKGGPMEVL